MLWYYETAWHDNPVEALKSLQAEFVAENYDLATMIPEYLQNAKHMVEVHTAERDKYGILEMCQEQLSLIERLANEPIPTSPEGQVEIVRQLHVNSGEGVGNVLDVEGVSDSRKWNLAYQLVSTEIEKFAGTAHPNRKQAEAAIDKIHAELNRAGCVCFPFYSDQQPTGWMLVGNTFD